MKMFIKELIYKGCREDFIEDKVSSNIALTFDIFVSMVSAAILTGVLVMTGLLYKIYEIIPVINEGEFAFFLTIFIFLMVALYLPSFKYQERYLKTAKISRPFYLITEIDEEKIELHVDFDKDHKRTNKLYRINLNVIEGLSTCYDCDCLTDDIFIRNSDFVKAEDNPTVQFIRIDTNKVGSLTNIGNRKISYIVPRYDDFGVDLLKEINYMLER